MRKTIAIAAFLAAASFNTAMATQVSPKIRTALPAVSFEEVLKRIAVEIAACKRLHGVMTKVTAATMKGNSLEIKGDVNQRIIDNYPMKGAPTPAQVKSLIGQPICDPN